MSNDSYFNSQTPYIRKEPGYFRYVDLESRQRPKKRVGRFLITVFGAIVIFYLGFVLYSIGQSKISSEIVTPAKVAKFSENVLGASEDKQSLKEVIDKSLEGTKGNYAVSIKNLKTGESFDLNETRSFEAGSLYKLWVMAAVYQKIEKGELKKDQVLSQNIETLNSKFNIDPEFAEQTEGGITLSVKNALTQMITISHNYAALLLTEKIRLSSVESFLEQNGFSSKVGTESSTGAPTTNSSDIALFFEKLHKGELANSENTNEMINLLKQQKLNNKFPKYMPDDVVIAHKTGELGLFTHDAGIVFASSGEYIIVVLSESSSPVGAEDRIAKVSEVVYQYFKED